MASRYKEQYDHKTYLFSDDKYDWSCIIIDRQTDEWVASSFGHETKSGAKEAAWDEFYQKREQSKEDAKRDREEKKREKEVDDYSSSYSSYSSTSSDSSSSSYDYSNYTPSNYNSTPQESFLEKGASVIGDIIKIIFDLALLGLGMIAPIVVPILIIFFIFWLFKVLMDGIFN